MMQALPLGLESLDEGSQSFLDLEDPGDEISPADIHSFPPVAQRVPGLQELISFLDMEILEDEIDAIPTAFPLVSQCRPFQTHPNNKATTFPNIHTNISTLDPEKSFGVDRRSPPVPGNMPRHPQPARVRRSRRPIIQVPEPQKTASCLNVEKLADEIDVAPTILPLPSQRRPSQAQPFTTVNDPPNTHPHGSHSDAEKFFGDGDGSRMLGALALGGLCLCALFGVTFIGLGIFVSKYQRTLGNTVLPPGAWRTSTLPPMYQAYKGVVTILPGTNYYAAQMLSLGLDIVVTLCTESVGYVHSVALRSALAAASQLKYNTNLRLFPPLHVKSWIHPNGTLCNALMACFLILAYSSSSMVFIQLSSSVYNDNSTTWYSTAVFAEPLIVLGTSLLLPVIISLCSIWQVTVLTWSFSPFNVTKALLRAERVARIPGKCMTNVVDTTSNLPRGTLRDRQPSAWESHPQVPFIVSMMWVLALVFALCGVANFCIWTWFKDHGKVGLPVMSWAFLPNGDSNQTSYWQSVDPDKGYPFWARNILIVAISQGFLTLGLHGCEVVVNVIRDEAQWRLATSPAGMQLLKNPLLSQLGNWPNVALLLAKPFLHWMFSLALDFRGFVTPLADDMMTLEVNVRTVQILYLSISILVVAVVLTILARRRPHGYQPAAYGHIQTLANLVDKWTSILHWGEKPGKGEAGELYNTGTDGHPLPQPTISDWFSMV